MASKLGRMRTYAYWPWTFSFPIIRHISQSLLMMPALHVVFSSGKARAHSARQCTDDVESQTDPNWHLDGWWWKGFSLVELHRGFYCRCLFDGLTVTEKSTDSTEATRHRDSALATLATDAYQTYRLQRQYFIVTQWQTYFYSVLILILTDRRCLWLIISRDRIQSTEQR